MANTQILILKGSPRERGNSALLADQLAAGAQAAGAEVESYYLHSMDIRPCDACDICQETGEGCIIEDDMQILYPRLRAADAIVIASPIYWFTMSAQAKICIDRWYALQGKPGNLLACKRIGIILAFGDTDPYTSGAINAIRTFQDMFRFVKAEIAGIVYASAMDAGDVKGHPDVMEQAYQLGHRLAVTG